MSRALPMRPPTLRHRLLLAVAATLVLGLGALIATFNFVQDRRLEATANGLLRNRAAAQLAALDVLDGRLRLSEAPDDRALDSSVWVFSTQRTLESPPLGPTLDRAASSLRGANRRFVELPSRHARLYALTITRNGRRLGTVVTALSLTPYDKTRRDTLIGSLVLAAVLLGGLLLAARALITRALRPVARMSSQAADWSDRDPDRRFTTTPAPRDEIGRLAVMLNRLLDQIAASLRHEQQLTAELSHEMRTPLAQIVIEAQLARRRPRSSAEYEAALDSILESARRLTDIIETLLVAARGAAATASADAGAVAQQAASEFAQLAAERRLTLAICAPRDPVRVAADSAAIQRMLAPVLENACRHAAGEIRLEVHPDGGHIVFSVSDDGLGVDMAHRDDIFRPGWQGQTSPNGSGAGLGLALGRRLAEAAGGRLELDGGPPGARFLLRLPRA